jgi:D-alanyl-D-alanine dipeptidase
MKFKVVILALILISFSCSKLPNDFVYVQDLTPSIQIELRYFSNNNFIGKPIDGYHKETVIVTKPTAVALAKVQKELLKKGLSLKIYDAYRPQQAVDHFVRWAKVLNDTVMKRQYYPDVAKKDLFKKGFIAAKSGHTRGSTVDLTIVNQKTGKELDMGSPYDFFGKESHPFYENIQEIPKKNRLYLREIMLRNGFKPYENEWWHFTLKNEPFPNTYFNFPIE